MRKCILTSNWPMQKMHKFLCLSAFGHSPVTLACICVYAFESICVCFFVFASDHPRRDLYTRSDALCGLLVASLSCKGLHTPVRRRLKLLTFKIVLLARDSGSLLSWGTPFVEISGLGRRGPSCAYKWFDVLGYCAMSKTQQVELFGLQKPVFSYVNNDCMNTWLTDFVCVCVRVLANVRFCLCSFTYISHHAVASLCVQLIKHAHMFRCKFCIASRHVFHSKTFEMYFICLQYQCTTHRIIALRTCPALIRVYVTASLCAAAHFPHPTSFQRSDRTYIGIFLHCRYLQA